jgi:thioredoxin-like negative regulator of GroEL
MERITSQELEKRIDNKESFILKLSASWCGPCKQLTEEINKSNVNVPVYEFDVESDVVFSRKMNVRSVPVMKFFKNGVESLTTVGLRQASEIKTMSEQYIL